MVSTYKDPTQHLKLAQLLWDGPGDLVVAKVQMHQTGQGRQRGRDFAGDEVVGGAKQTQMPKLSDVGGESAGYSVPREVDDAEEGERGDAARDLAGDFLPVGDDERGEVSELANLRGDVTGNVLGMVRLLERGVDWTGAEADFGDAAGDAVAGDAAPVAAAVGAGPGVEYSVGRCMESGFEGQQRGQVRRRTRANGGGK